MQYPDPILLTATLSISALLSADPIEGRDEPLSDGYTFSFQESNVGLFSPLLTPILDNDFKEEIPESLRYQVVWSRYEYKFNQTIYRITNHSKPVCLYYIYTEDGHDHAYGIIWKDNNLYQEVMTILLQIIMKRNSVAIQSWCDSKGIGDNGDTFEVGPVDADRLYPKFRYGL